MISSGKINSKLINKKMSKLTEAEKILELHFGSDFYKLQEHEFYRNIKNALNEAINYTRCCKSDSEQFMCECGESTIYQTKSSDMKWCNKCGKVHT